MKRHVLKYFSYPKYWEPVEEIIDSADMALRLLTQIEKSYQPKENEGPSARLISARDDSMHVCLGRDEWALIYHDGHETYCVSLGDERAEGHKPFLFPEWTEMDRKYLVPSGTAQNVLRAWLERGDLSDQIRWER